MLEKVKKSDLRWMKYWTRMRIMGLWKFAFSQGLAYGITMHVIMGFFNSDDNGMIATFISLNGLLKLAVWLLAGVFGFGISLWYLNNYIYRKKLAKYNLSENDIIATDT